MTMLMGTLSALPSSSVLFVTGGLRGPEPTMVRALTDMLYTVYSSKPRRRILRTGPLVVIDVVCCCGELTSAVAVGV